MRHARTRRSPAVLAACAAAGLLACGGQPSPAQPDPLPEACAPRSVRPGLLDASAPPHERAIAALGGDPATIAPERWRELAQGFWPHWRVYRFEDPAHAPRALAAAVDAAGRVVALTNTRPLARENDALACFNALSRSERVRVGHADAAAYLAFFLWTQLAEVEQFLRGRPDAESVLAHPWRSRHDEWLLVQLVATREPPLALRPAGRGFSATAWEWRWSRGVVHRYELSTTREGQVRFRATAFGSQRPREGPSSTATCFAVHPDGWLLTAAHAVEGAHAITLRFVSGDARAATVARTAPDADLALLRVEGGLPAWLPLSLRAPERSERVYTLGFPGPRLLWSEPDPASGTVRAAGPAPALIETDVPAHAGNSGGPLVDVRGEVVGVLSRIAETPDERWRATLAVPAAEARRLLDELPAPPSPAASPEEAARRVRAAVCEVEAELVDAAGATSGSR
jgi:S1-C subfamily serine protease